MKLASIYWFTVEFGLVKSRNEQNKNGMGVKVMGAGILSSYGEMEWSAASDPSENCREMGGITKTFKDLKRPNLLPFDPWIANSTPYPITTYQPTYFVGESINEVKNQISDYCDSMSKDF